MILSRKEVEQNCAVLPIKHLDDKWILDHDAAQRKEIDSLKSKLEELKAYKVGIKKDPKHSIYSMVEKYLKDNNLDSLIGDDCKCILSDRVPCETITCECVVGINVECKSKDCGNFECECGGYKEGRFRMEGVELK